MPTIKRSNQTDDQDFLNRLAHEYYEAKKFAEAATKRADELKKQLSAAVDSAGVPDHKGNRWLAAGKYELKRERRVSKSIDEHGIEAWAKENAVWKDISQTVEQVVEDKVLTLAFERPDLAPSISSFFVEKEVWAFKISEAKETAPDSEGDPT